MNTPDLKVIKTYVRVLQREDIRLYSDKYPSIVSLYRTYGKGLEIQKIHDKMSGILLS